MHLRNIFLLVVIAQISFAQSESNHKIYKINPWIDGSIIAAGAAITFWGLDKQESLSPLPFATINALDPNDVNAFDRRAIYRDPTMLEQNLNGSDIALNITTMSIVLLAFDKKARHHWIEGLTMYVESIAITTAIQSWVAYGTGRIRPIAYMEDVEIGKRVDKRNSNSFYSGHAAGAATSSFFIAKMLSDLHPEWGKKRIWLFVAAVLPPAIVGNFRIGAGKHFYTDVFIGTAMGAASGILTPHLHKIEQKTGLGIRPLIGPKFVGGYLKFTI